MTPEEAATIQGLTAIAQVFLTFVIGGATVYFGYWAKRLLKLQTEAAIDPDVSLDLYPWVAEKDEPLNYVVIENHSPLQLNGVTLSAEIFGDKAGCPTSQFPASHHFGELPDLGPQTKQLSCIDEAMEKAIDVMKIGRTESSPCKGVFTALVRLHLHYRRKSDGVAFNRKLLLGVFKKPELRPMAVFPRTQLQQ